MKRNRFHLAGAVPWRKTEDGLEILLITARDKPLDEDNFWWIVPQGGVGAGADRPGGRHRRNMGGGGRSRSRVKRAHCAV